MKLYCGALHLPVGDEVNEPGYNHMFTDMFNAAEEDRDAAETFYVGYVVNAIMDAAYRSSEAKLWEKAELPARRGLEGVLKLSSYMDYDEDHCLIKDR